MITNLCLFDFGGRGGISLGFVLLLPLILSGLIGWLRILGRSRYGSLSLGFVPAMIFYRFLSLDFVYGGMGRSISLEDLLVSLSYVETWS